MTASKDTEAARKDSEAAQEQKREKGERESFLRAGRKKDDDKDAGRESWLRRTSLVPRKKGRGGEISSLRIPSSLSQKEGREEGVLLEKKRKKGYSLRWRHKVKGEGGPCHRISWEEKRGEEAFPSVPICYRKKGKKIFI